MKKRISPTLWFDNEAEDAARFYTGIFKNSKMGTITRYPESGQEITGKAPGTVLTVDFEIDGEKFVGLNGGPDFKFNESISFAVYCNDQSEIDYYWDNLGAGGDPSAQQCGWLKDKFGVSWQVVPEIMQALITDPDQAKRERAFAAMMEMKKLDIAALKRAHDGQLAKTA